jgi:hypothetical protein
MQNAYFLQPSRAKKNSHAGNTGAAVQVPAISL